MTMLQERLTTHRNDKDAAKRLRIVFGVDAPFYDPEFAGMTASDIAMMIETEITNGVSHWYADLKLSKTDCLKVLADFRKDA